VLPNSSVGRPKTYCGHTCRQRAYEQRSAATKVGISPDLVLVKRAELDALQDRLFQLRCAIEDVQTLLAEKHTKAELERSLADLVRSTGRLDRLWVTERAS
jgi:nucleotidyltransferase/DNA polymerase involved in DNA repair